MSKDWIFTVDNSVCDVRVAGVLVQNGKILVQRDRNGSEYAIPGGHIKIGEQLSDGLVREYKEETGADIVCKRMIWSEECFWEWNGKKAHNLTFYFLIELAQGAAIADTGEFKAHKDNAGVVFGWMPVEELAGVTIYPEFIKQEIHRLDAPMRHFVSQG